MEQTKKCPKCKSEIDKGAKICPHCRSSLGMSLGKILLAVILAPCVFFIAYGMSSAPTPEVPAEEQMSPEELAEWQKTKAGKLCAGHPGWKKEECGLLAEGKIWVGIGYDMLVHLRGRPDSSNPSNYGGGIKYQYCWHDYSPSCFYDNDGDKKMDAFN